MIEIIEWTALGQVLFVGLLVGAGVPTMFALGLRLLTAAPVPVTVAAAGSHGAPAGTAVMAVPPFPRRAAGYLCLALCLGAILTGLAFLISGGH